MNNEFDNRNDDINAEMDIGETANDNKDLEDIKESEEENKKGGEIQPQDDGKEDKAAKLEEENIEEKEPTDGEQEKTVDSENDGAEKNDKESNLNTAQRFSTSYAPPYYKPHYTSYQNYETASEQPKGRRGSIIALVAAICVFCTVLAAFAGAFLGYTFRGVADPRFENEELTILQGNKTVVTSELPEDSTYSDLTVSQIAALVGESVVEITTTQVKTNSFYGQYVTSGAGSGVFFTQDTQYGYIVTNYHVIEGADEISVRVKRAYKYVDYKATYIAGDIQGDIAVLKIGKTDNESFVVAAFGDSSKLRVGETVVAIGNPLGKLGGTVTDGIISALDREIIIEDFTMTLLQTNAAMNPGNSGGGLFDTSGLLVGIVNAKKLSSGIEGLGFAIPANKVKEKVTDILEKGYVTGRPTLGITVAEGTINRGAQTVVYVADNDDLNFEYEDIISKIGDTEISVLSDYNYAVSKLTIGEKVSITVLRTNRSLNKREEVVLEVTVEENKLPY
jgi:serine protease Do